MVYIGDCYRALGREELALTWWNEAFLADGTRREPLMRLAWHFFHKDDKHKTAAFAAAALAIPHVGFYMDNAAHYRHEPHELLYWAFWWLGDRAGAAEHWRKALAFQPQNEKYQKDAQFFI
jgi:tetratricopeptide (TPR) repeat protein